MGGINVRPPGGVAGARRVGLSVGVGPPGGGGGAVWYRRVVWRSAGGLSAHQFEESSEYPYSLPKLSE